MKNIPRKQVSLAKSRWAIYATAGAATALAAASSAEGEIFYSGLVDIGFNPPPGGSSNVHIQLDKPGDSLNPAVVRTNTGTIGGIAEFRVYGVGGASVVGFTATSGGAPHNIVSKLGLREKLYTQAFVQVSGFDLLAYNASCSACQWNDAGVGMVGFKFNDGTGWHYGWARLKKMQEPKNFFKLIDYAYGGVDEPIRTGQKFSHADAPDEGSLGLLAVGAAGLLAWRKSRSQKRGAQA